MHCPSCNEPLNQESVEGVAVDRCPNCQGVWFDETELGRVVRRMAAPDLDGTASGQGTDGLGCPKCDGRMTLFNYAYDSGVFVNRCRACAGLWLEKGQLDLLAQYRIGTPAVRSLAKTMGEEVGRVNRWQRIRALLRSRTLSGSVAAAEVVGFTILTGEAIVFFRMVQFMLFPLFCIWFCDGVGKLPASWFGIGRRAIRDTAPGDCVAIGGWFLMICPIIAMVIIKFAA